MIFKGIDLQLKFSMLIHYVFFNKKNFYKKMSL